MKIPVLGWLFAAALAMIGAGGAAEAWSQTYLVEKMTGARFNVVSMKSGGDAVIAVLGGHVQATTENLSEMMQHVEAKKMRILGVPAEKRVLAAPEVPTMKEQGMDLRVGVGRGFAAPADVPKEITAALEAMFEKVYKSAAWREYAMRNMYEDVYMGSAEFARYLAARQPELAQYIHETGLARKKP